MTAQNNISQRELAEFAVNKTLYGYATEYVVLDSNPFDFHNHNYLVDMYLDDHPYQVIEKAAQMGASVLGMVKAFFVCDKMERNVIYFFPTDEDVREFSKGRVAPIIRDSPHLASVVGDADAVGLRSVGRGFLYFRGMRSNIRMKCHDQFTEVLTRSGWKFFDTVTKEDFIATRSPSGKFMWQHPTDVCVYDYAGKMLLFKAAGTDIVVTPNHRMLMRAMQSDTEWFELAEDRKHAPTAQFIRSDVTWDGEFPNFLTKVGREEQGDKWLITVPGNKKNNAWESAGRLPSRQINLRHWVAFLGLYLAEGTTQGVMGGTQGGRICVSQVETSKHFKRIKELLPNVADGWVYSGHSFRVGDMELAKLLFPLGNKYTKFIPEWVKNLPPRFLQILWEWAVIGDGSIQNTQVRYATVSKRLADDMQEILMKIGTLASVKVQQGPQIPPTIRGRQIQSSVPCYNVLARTTGKTTVAPRPIEQEYTGTVGCVSVPNGVILTRRNGLTVWSGNSVPADLLIFDELDEVSDDQLSLADKRLQHSTLKWRMMLSTPTYDNYGIDRFFRKSDQRYWNLICHKCNTRNILEKQFPDCVKRISEMRCILICRKCSSELDTQYGVWVPETKVERIRGYHLCALYSAYANLSEIMYDYEEGRQREEFMRSVLGVPFVSSDQRLTAEIVERCCDRYDMGSANQQHTYMGVDQRGREQHVVIRGRDQFTKRPKILLITRVEKFTDLDPLMSQYDVDCAVVDGTPNQHSARDFCKRFPGRAYMAYYHDTQHGSYKWQESESDYTDYQVTVNRTEALDAMYEEVTRRDVSVPNPNEREVHTFIDQLCNLARINEVDEVFGVKRAIYKKLGDDHYAHANAYSCIAQSRYGEPSRTVVVQSQVIGTTIVSRRYENSSIY